MVEFAIVVVLLITLLYGIVTYGLILAAQSTVTQAAADAARAGVVTSSPASTAEAQAAVDVGWMNKGTCYQPDNGPAGSPTAAITCTAVKEACPSNTTTGANLYCLKVTVLYNYNSNPLFPELPGLNVITPSVISSTNILQIPTSG